MHGFLCPDTFMISGISTSIICTTVSAETGSSSKTIAKQVNRVFKLSIENIGIQLFFCKELNKQISVLP